MKKNESIYAVTLVVHRGKEKAWFEVNKCHFQDERMMNRVGDIDHTMLLHIDGICYESEIDEMKQKLITTYRKDISKRIEDLKKLYDKTLGEIE